VNKQPVQFLFGDRELLLGVYDLLMAPVDVIVNPANSGLSHDGGLAAQILAAAGDSLEEQSKQLIREYRQIDSGMAVYTEAGRLSYKAVIHAVGPTLGEGDEQYKIERAISRSLQLCEINNWCSIAFPAISTGHFNVPVQTCAQAVFRSITHFWDARHECVVEKIVLCLTERNYQVFLDAFHEDAIVPDLDSAKSKEDSEALIGHIDLTDDDIRELESDETDDWFKR